MMNADCYSTMRCRIATHIAPGGHEEVKEEVRSNISSFEDMTLEKLAGLKFNNACLQEAMRIYPPVSLSSLILR